jgi:intracellular septation protein
MQPTDPTPARPSEPNAASRQREHAGLRFVIDLAPLLVFFGTYMKFGIQAATAALMAATALAVIVSWWLTAHVPKALQITAALVFVFGALTLALDDPRFIMRKPTMVYLLFAAALGVGLASGRNFLATLLGQAFSLDAEGWRKLTWRWMGFFVAMAVVNEILIQVVSLEAWVKFKTFGFLGLTLAFGIAQIGLIKRHGMSTGTGTGAGTGA